MKCLRIIILSLTVNYGISQTRNLELILNADHSDPANPVKPNVHYAFIGKSAFIKYNPVSLIFGGGLLFYQSVISRQLMQGCAFHPSCSNFSKQSIIRFGLLKGVALSTDRLTRCTRLSAVDFHPVLFNADGKVTDLPEFYSLRK